MRRSTLAMLLMLLVAFTGCGSPPPKVMPDVVGLQLDTAISDIERAGIKEDPEIIGGGVFGVLNKSNWQVCEQLPKPGEAVAVKPRLTVERSCEQESGAPSPAPVEATPSPSAAVPTPEPTATPAGAESPAPSTYVYSGPEYEVVVTDSGQTKANLKQFWVFTTEINLADGAFKEQVKAIITDLAHQEKSPKFLASVVTDKEIAWAESPSTQEAFIKEHGVDYAVKTIREKEVEGWVAAYTGGFDYNTAAASDSAFEILWRPYATEELEEWKPELGG